MLREGEAEGVDFGAVDRLDLLLADDEPLVAGAADGALGFDDARMDRGEAGHDEGHEREGCAGESGADAAAVHVVEAEEEGREGDGEAVARDALWCDAAADGVEVLLELAGEEECDHAHGEHDAEAEEDHRRGANHVEGGVQQAEEAEGCEEGDALDHEAPADVGEAEDELLEEEGEGDEEPEVPEDAGDRFGDGAADDGMVEDLVGEAVAEFALSVEVGHLVGVGDDIGRDGVRGLVEGEGHGVGHAVGVLELEALLREPGHGGQGLGGGFAEVGGVGCKVAGAVDFVFGGRIGGVVEVERTEAEGARRGDEFVVHGAVLEEHEEALVWRDELHEDLLPLVLAGGGEGGEAAAFHKVEVGEGLECLGVDAVEEGDGGGAVEDVVDGDVVVAHPV